MSLNKLLSAVALAAVVSTPAIAADSYVGGGLTRFTFSADYLDEDANLSSVFAKYGQQYGENLAAEVRLGFGYGESAADDVDWSVDNFYGAFVKAGAPIGSVYPYAIAGYTRGKLTGEQGGDSSSESESDFSFGAGVDFEVADDLKIGFEYVNYISTDDGDLDGITFAIQKSL